MSAISLPTRFGAVPSRVEARLTLAAVCLAALCLPLGFTGAAVALHAIGQEFGAGPEALMWVNNAFMLAFGSLLLVFGTLADRQGRRRWFLSGTALFAAASVAAWAAPGIVALDLLRALQGVGAAAILSSGPAALAQVFDEPARPRAYSLLGASFGVGLAFGPLLAGALVHGVGWRSFFLVLAALTAGAGLLGAYAMRESRNPAAAAQRVDWLGASSFTLGLALFTWAVLRAPERGWADASVLALLVVAAGLLLFFVRTELRVAHPMLDLRLFRSARFAGVQWLAVAPAWSFVVLLVLLPLRFIGAEGWPEVQVGWWMLALSGPMLVVPLLSGWLVRWVSAGVLSGVGLLGCAAGLAWLAQWMPGDAPAALLPPLLLIGCGIGLPWGLMDGLAVSVVPREQAGMAAGIFNTLRVAGEGIAVALVGTLLAALVQAQLPHGATASAAHQAAAGDLVQAAALLPGVPAPVLHAAYAQAFQSLLYLLAGISVVSALVAFRALRRPSVSRAAKTGTASAPASAGCQTALQASRPRARGPGA
ncbi:MFS transporter [Xylophilus sp. GW821-FHT01B05]